jgi:glycosidase
MEFHIARAARERYQFAESLFSYNGNVILASLSACREFTHRMNTVRDTQNHPELAVHAGQLYAIGLIDEISHMLMARYREQFDPHVITSAIEWFAAQVGEDKLDAMLLAFVEQFPGSTVISGQHTPKQWLEAKTDGMTHKAAALEELMLLWAANRNQAFQPFEELFEEKTLEQKTVYRQVTAQLPVYFASRPLIPVADAKPVSLLDLLRLPAMRSPESLSDQLELIRKLWRPLIGADLDKLIELATGILREEELAIWMQFNPIGGDTGAAAERARRQQHGIVASAEVPDFTATAHEYEKFSPDTAWMPGAVLIAKSTYVWLAQLSRKYSRHIGRLDEIPDVDLQELADHGINSLWLIGVWERSRASRTIKQLCGNQDAVASAYSLFDYRIADDLGGEAAYITLRDRAYHHGIRLASDMVPNHMGIDSPWVIEHPEWFISRPDRPYPAYSFEGPDLSHDGRVELKIEDHYYDQSDAAVVFRRRDKYTGDTRYIYHGNDGTSFPWNDTAQLDYLNPAVREQVIQTILHVARLFPVIRFDAAMTLAKRHFHRLWFPGPGSSGAIPSRAEYGMSQADFDRAMPHEFWREVVDRVAAEVPGTLLLAEAFWLMEGYFVRTLGMHRVYNSAFMIMMRDEDNAKYRSVIKNTLEFDPDIMKRYVNFMSNPDERTAIDQFGKGDKYFGVAVMMSTLPGLPMFGHGQIEGFTEKYGMEYRWPRYREDPDHWLVERHEREVAPLLKRRWLFAESAHFLLYDFFHANGSVNEDVFAYSNRTGGERALVVYHNRYADAHGTIDFSAAYADKGSGQLNRRRLADGLGLSGDRGAVVAFRDSITDLKYLRRASDLFDRGLTLNLHAYQCQVFFDWHELNSTAEKPWDRLADWLNGRGVASLDEELVNLELQPVHEALRSLLDPGLVRHFADVADHGTQPVGVSRTAGAERAHKIERQRNDFMKDAWPRAGLLLRVVKDAYAARLKEAGEPALPHEPAGSVAQADAFTRILRAAMHMPTVEALFPKPWTAAARSMLPSPSPQLTATEMWGPVLAWCALEWLAESICPAEPATSRLGTAQPDAPQYATAQSASAKSDAAQPAAAQPDAARPERIALDLFDRLRLREPIGHAFTALGFKGEEAWRAAARIKVLLLTGAGAAVTPDSSVMPDSVVAPVSGPAVPAASTLPEIAPNLKKGIWETKTATAPARVLDAETGEGNRTAVGAPGPSHLGTGEGKTAPSTLQSAHEQVALAPILWLDPDVRWLCGVHEAEGHFYLVREQYEELLWWLLMPALLRLAAEPAPSRASVEELSNTVATALTSAEAAGYRIDTLLGPLAATEAGAFDETTEPPAPESAPAPDKKT